MTKVDEGDVSTIIVRLELDRDETRVGEGYTLSTPQNSGSKQHLQKCTQDEKRENQETRNPPTKPL